MYPPIFIFILSALHGHGLLKIKMEREEKQRRMIGLEYAMPSWSGTRCKLLGHVVAPSDIPRMISGHRRPDFPPATHYTHSSLNNSTHTGTGATFTIRLNSCAHKSIDLTSWSTVSVFFIYIIWYLKIYISLLTVLLYHNFLSFIVCLY